MNEDNNDLHSTTRRIGRLLRSVSGRGAAKAEQRPEGLTGVINCWGLPEEAPTPVEQAETAAEPIEVTTPVAPLQTEAEPNQAATMQSVEEREGLTGVINCWGLPQTEPVANQIAGVAAPVAPTLDPPDTLQASATISPDDVYLFNEGTHHRMYRKLGSHLTNDGVHFAVWAPNAQRVSLVGDFNGWNGESHRMQPVAESGIWELFVPGIKQGSLYKYRIFSHLGSYVVDKADPYATMVELPPKTASVVWPLDYDWDDAEWLARRGKANSFDAPISIYEVHLGSWMHQGAGGRSLSYRDIAHRLAEHVNYLGFTHVEFLPLTEHPYYGSWGYQVTNYFAPTGRYGTPQDLKYLIDTLHQAGIGVILDWVPSHFATDEHGLTFFDGTHLYEHADPRQGYHPDWGSNIFNFGRNEVRSFLLSSAVFWLDEYHFDGIRVDGVASMLYLDYSRDDGEWLPNRFGGHENLEAIDFLRQLNSTVYQAVPGIQTFAEESTSWPMVSRPPEDGGLGFGYKWDMGWMHDTLAYFQQDPVHRKFHHNNLTFRMLYAFNENFVLPLSHDEVVHMKGSLLRKMAGDDWQKRANLRALYGYMYAQSGKKLLFMGGEFGQLAEWNHDGSLDWYHLDDPQHAGLQRWLVALNHLYRHERAMHVLDTEQAGFAWIQPDDADLSVISLMRQSENVDETVVAIFNLTPVPRQEYRVGVPAAGRWVELLNSDATEYGGSGMGNMGGVDAVAVPWNRLSHSINVTLPPLSALFFKLGGWRE